MHGRLAQNFGIIRQFLLLHKQSNDQPQERQWCKRAFKEAAQVFQRNIQDGPADQSRAGQIDHPQHRPNGCQDNAHEDAPVSPIPQFNESL